MPRPRRLMVEHWPFHPTHRGNQRQRVFHDASDHDEYRALLKKNAERYGIAVWAYCLMPNHVHLIAQGADRQSIPLAIGTAHRIYARRQNSGFGRCPLQW